MNGKSLGRPLPVSNIDHFPSPYRKASLSAQLGLHMNNLRDFRSDQMFTSAGMRQDLAMERVVRVWDCD